MNQSIENLKLNVMKKLIGMFMAALFTVSAAQSVSAQNYHKYEKHKFKHGYVAPPYGHAWGHREHIDVIQPRPYYGFRNTWDGRTILIENRRYHLDRHGRYFYNGRYYYYHR